MRITKDEAPAKVGTKTDFTTIFEKFKKVNATTIQNKVI